MYTKATLLLAIISLLFVGCKPHTEPNTILVADSLLWANPDSCISFCIEKRNLCKNDNEKAIITLIQEHASFKIARTLESDSTLSALEEYFSSKDDYRHLGEVYYILGTSYALQEQFNLSATYLKQAEMTFNKVIDVPNVLHGMLYFQFGCLAQNERLFTLSNEYQERAIQYLKKEHYPTYLAAAFMRLATNQDEQDIEIANKYIDSALYYAAQAESKILYKEIEIRKFQKILKQDTIIIEQDLQYLCDTCNIYTYAAELASKNIENQNYITAQEYLNKLSNDTTHNTWSKEQFYFLQSQLFNKQEKNIEAYQLAIRLYKWIVFEIESSAHDRIYIISQKYDVAKEQELRLQEQVNKQRAYLWIVVVLLVCICIGGYTYYINKKRKLELQLSNEQKKRLEQELESDRAILRARISERVEIAKDLYLWSSHHNEEIPDILGPLSPKQAAGDLQNWRNFYTEFNLCYNNVLAKLKEKHPALTETDLQYIALTLLKYDITEMSFLLRIEKQTIWNRRTSVKRHLGMPDETNLNEWIINDMVKEYEIVEPQRIQANTKKRRRKKE